VIAEPNLQKIQPSELTELICPNTESTQQDEKTKMPVAPREKAMDQYYSDIVANGGISSLKPGEISTLISEECEDVYSKLNRLSQLLDSMKLPSGDTSNPVLVLSMKTIVSSIWNSTKHLQDLVESLSSSSPSKECTVSNQDFDTTALKTIPPLKKETAIRTSKELLEKVRQKFNIEFISLEPLYGLSIPSSWTMAPNTSIFLRNIIINEEECMKKEKPDVKDEVRNGTLRRFDISSDAALYLDTSLINIRASMLPYPLKCPPVWIMDLPDIPGYVSQLTPTVINELNAARKIMREETTEALLQITAVFLKDCLQMSRRVEIKTEEGKWLAEKDRKILRMLYELKDCYKYSYCILGIDIDRIFDKNKSCYRS
jgi:hypothetical protein